MRYVRIPCAVRWPYIVGLLCVIFAFGLFVPASRAARAPIVSGITIDADITSDTTWSRANSPYLVTVPISVTNTATLTIEPGVEVQFAEGAGLLIAGGLNSQGTHAQQVRMVAVSRALWQGLAVVQPARNVLLQSVTIRNAAVGLAIRQQSLVATQASGRVDVLDSLFEQNDIGVDVDYSIATNAPRLTLRNSLLTNNGIGLRINGLPGSNVKPKFNHNSFVGNGIGALNLAAQAVKMQQQWWDSAGGPQPPTSVACGNPPAPGTPAAELVCGNIDFTPWSKVPAGRMLLPPEQGTMIESALGAAALGDNDVTATSVMTATVPAGTFTQTVDLLASERDFSATPPGQPTLLEFELTAVASGQEVHRFANNQQLTVDISYSDADLTGADPSKLVVYAYDETLGAWSFAGISTTVDPANHHIVARVEHLSRFSVTSVSMQDNMLPLIMR
jgi:hypothetical protein